MAGAEELGKKLIGEIEEAGLDEILQILRLEDGVLSNTAPHFNLQQLDRLIQAANETKTQTSYHKTAPPIIEVPSIGPGGGKSHFLYHLTALAVLPTQYGGKHACVIILDTDNAFSIARLATQLKLLLIRNAQPDTETSEAAVNDNIVSALRHVHIFRPQSLASLIATLDLLPTYLFSKARHYSFDREAAFIAIDSLSAFYWQDRAEIEDAAFLASTDTTSTTQAKPQSAYHTLSASLKATTKVFTCPAIVTTWHLGPRHQDHSFRPSLSGIIPSLRLVVQRLPVRKFPPGITVDQALREAGDRQKAVDEGKFECFVNEWRGSRFNFSVKDEGLVVNGEDEGCT